MGKTYVKKVMSPEQLLSEYPLPEAHKQLKAQRDEEIKKVFTGESDKFLVIIGPCSADNEDSVCDYIGRLAKVQDKVKDKILIIPRIYTNKPRTTGEGYKGIVHQPDPEKAPDLAEGLIAMRKMHLRSIAETHLFAADEMLYPENWPYLSDILSYVAIGARSVENQQHRLTASGIDIPCGMKNPTSGTYSIMLNSCIAAQGSHTFMYRGWEVKTDGNPYAHTILRGAVNKHVMNTICNATEERQTEAAAIAGDSDAMIVIGGKHSSNTQKLYEICKNVCPDTHFIQTLDDLDLKQFQSFRSVGITAGASTPNTIIKEVQSYVRNE